MPVVSGFRLAWQEAVVNAVAHRDYGFAGTAVDLHKYDDRLEVISPGVPPARDLGEGIPRMFDEMERAGRNPPEIDLDGSSRLHVVLRNEVVFDAETLQWLSRYDGQGLSRDQRRLLAWGHSHGGAFTSREYQKLVGTDIYGASRDIKDLIRRGLAASGKKGGRVYRILESAALPALPENLEPLLALLREKGFIKNADVQEALNIDRRRALALLAAWAEGQWLLRAGERKATKYFPGPLMQL